jgi:hypothetical protein
MDHAPARMICIIRHGEKPLHTDIDAPIGA